MWDPELAIDFVWGCFPRILDSHYKVDITGTSLLGATLSDVTFIFCTLLGILKKKIANTDIFFIGTKNSFGTLWNTNKNKEKKVITSSFPYS